MTNHKFQTLVRHVLARSASETWDDARHEWEIETLRYDNESTIACVCGYPDIRYLSTIRNKETGEEMILGSRCIGHFHSDLMNKQTKLHKAGVNRTLGAGPYKGVRYIDVPEPHIDQVRNMPYGMRKRHHTYLLRWWDQYEKIMGKVNSLE